ncbi:3-deoxy-7-phosphoheptulonate synthase [endosymbiont of Pachyrhynchus infernalis]|uniref:3-deoxy-7-phosphoheptulonate synthase n=1 Tax=endosymbiont of Pachyrhynchus infernalis TaxID=1971488 RepID=UPI000DC6F359|nr:3-deoxy-7-phosphoheptulonate synthase [endosymbiont of Pachyrhynchus infernalis]BBA84879.1 phospho-2-dehydro-3-deoxyheptonate aldolase [endosymbiont of Pachyrhynchus infernalis]
MNNIISENKIISPINLKNKFSINNSIKNKIINSIKIISNIINGKDKRLLIICGPCSIHDFNSSIDYAKLLYNLSLELNDKLYIVMRAYIEKPRTSIGWKGIVNDPMIDNSCNIEKGLNISRELLIQLIDIGIPISTEILNLNIYKYFDDLFSWVSIGARTSESQIHREFSSSLSIPVGFKNNTNGDILSSINAIKTSLKPHTYLGINDFGNLCIIKTKGNKNNHIILRGSKNKPNYFPEDINNCINLINENNLNSKIIIDCSHDNSYKDYSKQLDVSKAVIDQINNNNNLIGLMIESYIYNGNQLINNKLKYGISITDGCIGWKETKFLLKYLYNNFNR